MPERESSTRRPPRESRQKRREPEKAHFESALSGAARYFRTDFPNKQGLKKQEFPARAGFCRSEREEASQKQARDESKTASSPDNAVARPLTGS
jgi:isopenicillin N synthase-like dioxygenase